MADPRRDVAFEQGAAGGSEVGDVGQGFAFEQEQHAPGQALVGVALAAHVAHHAGQVLELGEGAAARRLDRNHGGDGVAQRRHPGGIGLALVCRIGQDDEMIEIRRGRSFPPREGPAGHDDQPLAGRSTR